MKKSNFYWQLIACLLFLSSCANKSPKEAAYIPKDATSVLTLDMTALQQKLREGGMSTDSLIFIAFGNDSASQKMKKMMMELTGMKKYFCLQINKVFQIKVPLPL